MPADPVWIVGTLSTGARVLYDGWFRARGLSTQQLRERLGVLFRPSLFAYTQRACDVRSSPLPLAPVRSRRLF